MISATGNHTIADTIFDNNTAGVNGGGLYINNGTTLTISGITQFTNNKATSNGGAISIESNNLSTVNITGGAILIDGNTAGGRGGGIMHGTLTPLTLSGNVAITNNSAGGNGGGIGSGGSAGKIFIMDGVRIADNSTADNCGGVGLQNKTLVMTGGVIDGNNATQGGGGVYIGGVGSGSVTEVSGNAKITNNTAGVDGGGIYNYSSATILTITDDAQIKNNTAGVNGGGVWMAYADLGKLTVGVDTVWQGNSANEYDPAVAPVDLPTYTASVSVPDFAWSTYPVGAPTASFRRGYNNYDISYTAIKFDVQWDLSGGLAGDGSGATSLPDDIVYHSDVAIQPIPDPIKTGYSFVGWYYDKEVCVSTGEPDDLATPEDESQTCTVELTAWDFATEVTSDLTLIAVWQLIPAPTPPLPTPPLPDVPNTGLFGLSRELTMASAGLLLTVSLLFAVFLGRRLVRRAADGRMI
jgi:uncharacterized repeat protein (TIGR02543 family)